MNGRLAQRISYNSVEELKAKLHEGVKKGQTALSFEVSETLFEAKQTLTEILGDLPSKFPIAVNGKGLQSRMLAAIAEREEMANQVTGYVGKDPISLFAEEGVIVEDYFNVWIEDIKIANEKLPQFTNSINQYINLSSRWSKCSSGARNCSSNRYFLSSTVT